ncbi:MAG: proline iminopeptidase-family hydrolase [Deltaproteobacteria bacterium]|nr:proline iminopeptidase-family hydrolase [Deltaproteobacteria bacterium]
MQEKYLPVPGGRVWCRVMGADRPGLPLLILHGGPGVPHDYLEPLAALATERPVIFYDQLGCGNSDRPSDPELWTVARFVEELDQVRQQLGLHRLYILGQSWGATLALAYLRAQGQEGVAGVVLAAPAVDLPQWVTDQRAYVEELPPEVRKVILAREAAQDFASPEYQKAAEVYYQRHLCRLDPWPASLERTLDKMGRQVYEHMWGPAEFTCIGTLRDVNLRGVLPGLTIPVLYTCGEFDEARPATVRGFAAVTPGARVAVLAGASHMHHLEKEAEFLKLLREFLAEAAPGKKVPRR